jgi:hypothetical protein
MMKSMINMRYTIQFFVTNFCYNLLVHILSHKFFSYNLLVHILSNIFSKRKQVGAQMKIEQFF